MIDKERFMRECLMITNKGDDETSSNLLVPLIVNTPQKIYLDRKTNRNVILKARQLGCSTIILADFFIDDTTINGLAASVISYGELPTQRLLQKVHRFHDASPRKHLMPKKGQDSTHMITFPSIDSSFYINTARATVVARGDTIHRCHLSEYAFYERVAKGRAEQIMAEVGQSVPLKGGILTIESSPNMRNDPLFNLYMGAKHGENNFKPFLFPWWLGDDYKLTVEDVKNLFPRRFDEDKEPKLKLYNSHKQYGDEENFIITAKTLAKELFDIKLVITDDQIRWRRYKIRELGRKFWREYLEDDVTCWLNPEDMLFDRNAIDRLLINRLSPLEFRVAEQMTVWEMPQGGDLYVIGADPSEGLPTSDFACAAVLKVSNGLKVAAIRGLFPVDRFAQILAQVGKEYNYATIAAENNAHGVAVNKWLENQSYPNLYWKTDNAGKPVKIGWTTSKNQYGGGTRDLMIDEFDKALRSGAYRTYDEQELTEIQEFVFIDGKAQGMDKDDALFAAMIAWMIREEALPILVHAGETASYLPDWL